jgi:hypothetical protein
LKTILVPLSGPPSAPPQRWSRGRGENLLVGYTKWDQSKKLWETTGMRTNAL